MTMRTFLVITIVTLIAFGLIFFKLPYMAEKSALIMGTPVRVKVTGQKSPYYVKEAINEIKRLDQLFSRLNPKSEVSMINSKAGIDAVKVSKDTLDCISLSQKITKISNGAFDITLGDRNRLVINRNKGTVFLTRRGVKINLGGIGKGFAAEKARRLLLKKGAKSGMIDMRSSIIVFGSKKWTIGIAHPRKEGKLLGKVILKDGQSLATSGDYERGKHILNPITKKAAGKCQGVTVIGRDAGYADALSTAVFVLGPDKGIKLVELLPDIEALVIDNHGKIIKSSGFELIKK
jgi:FAD:protein FMN transferase